MLHTLDDKTVITNTRILVAREQQLSAKLIAYLSEVDRRRLYADEGFPSMFSYLVDGLKYSEPAAARRLSAARVAQKHPRIIKLVEAGALHLTALQMLSSHVAEENFDQLINLSVGKSKKAIEEMLVREVGRRSPVHKEWVKLVPSIAASLPTPALNFAMPDEISPTPAPAVSRPLPAMSDVRLTITIDKNTFENLKRAQAIAHTENISETLKKTIDVYLDHKDQARKLSKPSKAQPKKSSVPTPPALVKKAAAVPVKEKREVYARHGAQCAHVHKETGQRCPATVNLEIEHKIPRAKGGGNELENLTLLCKAHNLLAARQVFGAAFMEKKMLVKEEPPKSS